MIALRTLVAALVQVFTDYEHQYNHEYGVKVGERHQRAHNSQCWQYQVTLINPTAWR
jgi:flagella basal body P-ring formation protein FlgA